MERKRTRIQKCLAVYNIPPRKFSPGAWIRVISSSKNADHFFVLSLHAIDSEIQAEQQDAISCLEDPVVENNSYGRILDDQTARYETMLRISFVA